MIQRLCCPGEAVNIDQRMTGPQVVKASQQKRLIDPLRHESLDALHDTGCLGGRHIEPLAQ